MADLVKYLRMIPEITAQLKAAGIPLSAVSAILRIAADIVDAIDKRAPGV